MKIEILTTTKKKKIFKILGKRLPYQIIKTRGNNYRIYSGTLDKNQLNILAQNLNIITIGAKLGTINNQNIKINQSIKKLIK